MMKVHVEGITAWSLLRSRLPLLVALLFIPLPAVAQEATDAAWTALTVLQPSERLRIRLHSGDTISGRLDSVSDAHLTVVRGNASIGTPRSNVQQVQHLTGPRVRRTTELGAIIGAGAGAAFGLAAFGCQPRSLFCIKRSEAVPVTAAIGAGLGLIVGYAVAKAGEKRTVLYTSPVP